MAVPVQRRNRAGASAARRGRQQRARERRAQHALAWWVLPCVACTAVLVGVWAADSGAAVWLAALLALAVVGVVMGRVYRPGFNSWKVGAAGERRTARLLGPLRWRGWVVLHDRAVPGSRANLDHLIVGPGGVYYVDTKNWASQKSRLTVRGGELWYGRYPQTRALQTVAWEAQQAGLRLGVPVTALVLVHGAHVPGGALHLNGVTLMGPARLAAQLWLTGWAPGWDASRVAATVALAEQVLPPHAG
jgi:hypothetical protein